jgi:hypothetical protein
MDANSAWVRGQRKMRQVLRAFGCWISPCYYPFSLGARFETYEPIISLIFPFFSDRGKPRILNRWIRGHNCTYILLRQCSGCATCWTVRGWIPDSTGDFLFYQHPRQFLAQPASCWKNIGFFYRGAKLITHLPPLLMLRVNWARPLFPHTSSCRGQGKRYLYIYINWFHLKLVYIYI